MKRRSFLRHTAHSLAIPGVLGSLGFKMPGPNSMESLLRLAADTDKVLVMVYLDGGNDGLNTVIPLDQLTALNKVRPHVILPEQKLLKLRNHDLALHPSLTGLHALYNESRLQVIQNVGYASQNYSHFRSTDIWMSGSDSNELLNSGWSGRFLNDTFPGYPEEFPTEDMPDPLSIEIGYGSSLLFQGPTSAMGMVINNTDGFYNLINDQDEPAPNTPAGDKLKYLRLIARQSQQYGEIVKSAASKVSQQATYPQTNIGEQLKIVSRLIAGGLRTPLYLVRLGGFDTHDAQVVDSDHTTGEHSELLGELNDAIMAFMNDLERQGTDDKVVGMTFSEFGRRIVSNASLGTDHGAAAPMFFFGNAVRGGVLGENPQISLNSTYDDNLDWEFDFRQLYASILSQWLGASDNQLQNSLFKNYDQLSIIGDPLLANQPIKEKGILVYPNPLNGSATIRLNATNENVSIDVLDMTGRPIMHLANERIESQKEIKWNTQNLPRGKYFVSVKGNNTNRIFPVLKVD